MKAIRNQFQFTRARVWRKGQLIFSLLVALTCLNACSNSSGGFDFLNPDYNGTWDIRFNLSLDGCGVAVGTIPGFAEQHFIRQTGKTIELEAISGLITTEEGFVDEEGKLFASEETSGDLFGDGSFCVLTISTSYTPTSEDRANALFSETIDCNDGFQCESRAVGEAVRQDLG